MCGIFGYIGQEKNASQITLEGLKLLEYRGYDSWGIAAKVKDRLAVEKHVGKIGNAKLGSKLAKENSYLAIGHTRWATHGGVSQKNAHPHFDCSHKIAVIHNGIIENFAELKKELLGKGHKFISETDTEVAAHLIEEYYMNSNFVQAVRKAFQRFQGMNALVVISSSDQIVVAKNGSPIVLGLAKNGFFVASDVSGIIKHTRSVVFLEDGKMAVIGKNLQVFNLTDGKDLKYAVSTLDWKFTETTKGNYPHFLLKEAHEQPKVIENISLNYLSECRVLVKLIQKAYGTFMLGCGTASYACLAGTYLFSNIAKKHLNFTIGSEFKYLEDYVQKGTLVIALSQSGETIDVVDPVAKARFKGATIAALVNTLGSTLYRQADFKILLGAGPEKAVIATKSFTAMVSVLLLTAYTLRGQEEKAQKLLQKAVLGVKDVLSPEYCKKIKKLASKLKAKEHIFCLGRGLSYATALEAALKIKETSYTHAEGFAGGELKHGVIALVEKNTPCMVFVPSDETKNEIISNAEEVKARGGFIIGIGSENQDVFDVFLETLEAGEASILPQIVVAQLFAYYLALAKGIKDPDKPRNLAKSVTVK